MVSISILLLRCTKMTQKQLYVKKKTKQSILDSKVPFSERLLRAAANLLKKS